MRDINEDFRLMEKLFWAIIITGIIVACVAGHHIVSLGVTP